MTACVACRERAFPGRAAEPAADRCDRDPQLKALKWLTEVAGTKIGTWPVGEVPINSATPAHVGGLPQRGAPCYAEDNEYVLGGLRPFPERDPRAGAGRRHLSPGIGISANGSGDDPPSHRRTR